MTIQEMRKLARREINAIAMNDAPACQCGNCKVVHRFKCHECLRVVPWCFGGGGCEIKELDDACAECWCALTESGRLLS